MAALVLVDVDELCDPADDRLVVTELDDLAGCPVVLHVEPQDRVEHFVGRQALVVTLVRPQLGRRRLGEHALVDDGAPRSRVDEAAQVVDTGLEDVLDDRIPADRVAVDREVADGHFTLVARGQHHPAELVGQRHQRDAAEAALHILLGEVGCPTLERRREHLVVGHEPGLDRDRAEVDAQPIGQILCIRTRPFAGVPRRHRHAVHLIGPERVDRDAGDERGIDAAGESDDDVGETVLADVVPRTDHERLVQLGIRGGLRRDPFRRRFVVRHRLLADGDELHLLLRAPTARIEETLAVHRFDRHVGDQELFFEKRGASHQVPVGVEHHAAPVEDELVLTAHLVDVGERAARIRSAGCEHALAGTRLAGMERRTVDVDVQLRPAGSLFGQRASGAPDVLADADAHLHTADDVQLVRVVLVAGGEVAGLVEHGVVRKQTLAVRAEHHAARAHSGGVVEVAIGGDVADHCDTAPRERGHLVQRGEVVGHEAGLEHQILRGVAGDRQLGERDEVAPRVVRAVVGRADLGDVAFQIADGGVDLGQCDAQPCHKRKATDLVSTRRRPAGPGSPPTGT